MRAHLAILRPPSDCSRPQRWRGVDRWVHIRRRRRVGRLQRPAGRGSSAPALYVADQCTCRGQEPADKAVWHTHVRHGFSPAPLGVAVESVQQRGQCDPQDGGLDEGGICEEDTACRTAPLKFQKFKPASLRQWADHGQRGALRAPSRHPPVKNSKMNRHQHTLSKTCIAGGMAIISRTVCCSASACQACISANGAIRPALPQAVHGCKVSYITYLIPQAATRLIASLRHIQTGVAPHHLHRCHNKS